MNKYDTALDLFTDISLHELYAQRPFRQERHTYATDKASIIQIVSTLPEEEYEVLAKPNAWYVMNKPKNRDKVFTLDGLVTLLNLIPKVDFEACHACGGDGEVDFEFEYDGETYYKSADCPVCHGTREKELDVAVRDFRYGVKFESDTWPLKQKYLIKLIKTMELLEVNSARLVYADTQTYKFELSDDVEVEFLCYHPKPEYEDFFICYKGEDSCKAKKKQP